MSTDQRNRPMLDEIAAIYDEAAETLAESTARSRAKKWTAHHERFLAQMPAHGTVLDLGFGSGWDLDYFADLGYDIAGLDISRRQVARVRERHPDSRILLGDISCANEYFAAGSFDGVWASSAVAHMDRIEAEKTFWAMYRVLAAGGTGYVSVTCRVDVNAPERVEKKTPSGNTVTRYDWLPDDLFDSLEQAGFVVVDSEYSGVDSPDAFVYVFLHKT